MQKTRAKFFLADKDPQNQSITMFAVTAGSPENDQFFAATPAGTVSMNFLNPKAFNFFEKGKDYYVDFILSIPDEDGSMPATPIANHDETENIHNTFGFDGALNALKNGKKVARLGWNGKNMWILAQFPDEHSKMTHPYLYIEYPEGHPAYHNGSRVPWLASQTDIMAMDWFVVY